MKNNQLDVVLSAINHMGDGISILARDVRQAALQMEQGRGFAVVVGEARNLAQRSSQAAREIRTLIAESISKVDAGAASVTQASDRMRDMVESVRHINGLVDGVALRADEQHGSVDQINQTGGGLARVTSQNATLVHRTNAIADALMRESRMLIDAVSCFKLEEAQDAAGADGSPAVAPSPRYDKLHK